MGRFRSHISDIGSDVSRERLQLTSDVSGAKIAAVGIRKHFYAGGRWLLVLDDVSMAARDGEFVSIIGPSGCGKSTLFNVLAGLESIDAGAVKNFQIEERELERRRRRSSSALRTLAGFIPPVALLALGLLAWQIIATMKNVPDYLLPTPTLIWQTTINEHDLLLTNTWPTLKIVVFGFLIAFALGFLLAVAINDSPLLERALYPIIIASQTIPLIALAPILVVLLGFTILPKLIVVALICFFPIAVNTVDGFKSVDPDQINLLRTLGAGRWRLFRDVQFPTALPYLFSGTKVAATFSVIGAIFGEWVGSSEGLGYVMIQKSAQLDTAALFSAVLILAIIGITLFAVVALAERLLLPWYHTEKKRDALSRR